MSELPSPNTRANHWPGQEDSGPSSGTDAAGEVRAHLLRISVLPTAVMALLGAVTAGLLLLAPSPGTRFLVLAVAVAACFLVLVMAVSRATASARRIGARIAEVNQTHPGVDTLRLWTARFQDEIQRFARQVRDGERPVPHSPQAAPVEGSHPFAFVAHDLQQAQHAAEVAMSQSVIPLVGDTDQRVGVFVNLARRLQSLIHRAIQKLDELEHQVEDPDLLRGLFLVDHLATGVRRQAESLAVLGGAAPRRQWSSPVNMYTVLRSAVAEVEQYARVKVVPPVDGTLRGHAVADVIHLVAELVENATMFSAPETPVTVRAQPVAAGLAIEIDDRGLGMPLEEQRRINDLLATPGHIDIGELLQDGRIGLCVVAELAGRHGVAVRLQNNIYGGIQAVVVLPHRVLGDAPEESHADRTEQPSRRELRPAVNGRAARELPAAVSTGTGPQPRIVAGSHGEWPAATRPGNGSAPPPATQPRHEVAVAAPAAERILSGAGFGVHAARGPAAPASPAVPTAAPAAAADSEGAHAAGDDDARPRLPQRRERATYLVPELLESRPANEPAAAHNPGLMAAFQRGINRASSAEDDEPTADHTT
jgi:signal transduction histidine kinase